jgi:hypothetical protein
MTRYVVKFFKEVMVTTATGSKSVKGHWGSTRRSLLMRSSMASVLFVISDDLRIGRSMRTD